MNSSTRNRRMTRRTVVRTLAAACAVGVLPAVAAGDAQAAPFCGITWGSMAKDAGTLSPQVLTDVRAGRHACYDRLVIDTTSLGAGGAPGYDVQYVGAVYTEGQGAVVPLRGGARLAVVAKSPAYGPSGPTYTPADRKELVNVTGYRTFRQVAWAGTFEGQTTVGLGVRARLPFRAFTLSDATGSRIVVDVAHAW